MKAIKYKTCYDEFVCPCCNVVLEPEAILPPKEILFECQIFIKCPECGEELEIHATTENIVKLEISNVGSNQDRKKALMTVK